MSNTEIAATIAVVALVTALVRGLPYLLFGGKREIPDAIGYLGSVLPAAIMIILVLYCLRGVNFTAYPQGLAELLSLALVTAVHLWKKNAVLSIVAGTACYMILIRTVFPI